METPNLPDEIVPLFNELRLKYRAAFEPLCIKDIKLDILGVDDLEPLLAGMDPFRDIQNFPFWSRLWEAAIVLANFMVSQPPKPGQTLLELGAGLGAPGLFAAAKGYRVTMSDYEPHILDFMKVSASANKLSGITFQKLDWLAPPPLPQYDTIIGAEILFHEKFFAPLLSIFLRFLAPDGVIFLAHDQRRKSLGSFLSLAEETFDIGVVTSKIKTDDVERTIVLTRLKRRANAPFIQ